MSITYTTGYLCFEVLRSRKVACQKWIEAHMSDSWRKVISDKNTYWYIPFSSASVVSPFMRKEKGTIRIYGENRVAVMRKITTNAKLTRLFYALHYIEVFEYRPFLLSNATNNRSNFECNVCKSRFTKVISDVNIDRQLEICQLCIVSIRRTYCNEVCVILFEHMAKMGMRDSAISRAIVAQITL